MSRTLGTPTPAAPYYARWTAASSDLGAATNGPVEIDRNIVMPTTTLACVFAVDAAGAAPEWHLIAEDTERRADPDSPAGTDLSVIAAIAGTTASLAIERRTARNNASGNRFRQVVQFDLRQLPREKPGMGRRYRFYLALVDADSATQLDLVEIRSADQALGSL